MAGMTPAEILTVGIAGTIGDEETGEGKAGTGDKHLFGVRDLQFCRTFFFSLKNVLKGKWDLWHDSGSLSPSEKS